MSPDDSIAFWGLFWATVLGLSAIVVPCFALLFSRRAATAVALLLSLAGTISTILYATHNHVGPNVNVRPDLMIYPLMLVAWLECAVLAVRDGWKSCA